MELLLIVCCVACGVSVFGCILLVSDFIFGDLEDDLEFCSNVIEQDGGEWVYTSDESYVEDEFYYKNKIHEAKMETFSQLEKAIDAYRASIGLESI